MKKVKYRPVFLPFFQCAKLHLSNDIYILLNTQCSKYQICMFTTSFNSNIAPISNFSCKCCNYSQTEGVLFLILMLPKFIVRQYIGINLCSVQSAVIIAFKNIQFIRFLAIIPIYCTCLFLFRPHFVFLVVERRWIVGVSFLTRNKIQLGRALAYRMSPRDGMWRRYTLIRRFLRFLWVRATCEEVL